MRTSHALTILALAALVALDAAPRRLAAQDGAERKAGEPGPDAGGMEKKGDDAKPDEKKADDKKPEGAKPDEKKAEPKKDAPKDDVDTDCLEARVLASKLHVSPNWRPASSSVDLTYLFAGEPELLDWKVTGADKAELADGTPRGPGGPGGPGRKGGGGKGGGPPAVPDKGLVFTVGSSSQALCLLTPVDLCGDFTLEAEVKLSQFGSSADLVFLVGVHGNEAVGVRYGDQFVKVKGASISALSKNAPSAEKFMERKPVVVKLARSGDELRTWINGIEKGSRKLSRKELDGKVGFLAAANVRVALMRVHVQGTIDRNKL